MDLEKILKANLASALIGDVRDDRPKDSDVSQDPRMWLFVRCDIKIPLEKLLAQAGHATSTCSINTERKGRADLIDTWLSTGQGKITKRAKSEAELRKFYDLCRGAGLEASIVTDAARSYFDDPTVTMAAVGPCLQSDLPKPVNGARLLTREDILALQPEPIDQA